MKQLKKFRCNCGRSNCQKMLSTDEFIHQQVVNAVSVELSRIMKSAKMEQILSLYESLTTIKDVETLVTHVAQGAELEEAFRNGKEDDLLENLLSSNKFLNDLLKNN